MSIAASPTDIGSTLSTRRIHRPGGVGSPGAQASIYSRAQRALELAFPLLDRLYTLDLTTDPEDVDALRKVARELVPPLR